MTPFWEGAILCSAFAFIVTVAVIEWGPDVVRACREGWTVWIEAWRANRPDAPPSLPDMDRERARTQEIIAQNWSVPAVKGFERRRLDNLAQFNDARRRRAEPASTDVCLRCGREIPVGFLHCADCDDHLAHQHEFNYSDCDLRRG